MQITKLITGYSTPKRITQTVSIPQVVIRKAYLQ